MLLFASKDDEGRFFWVTPGGGSERGETAEETARRELRKETGLVDIELGPELWRRRGRASWGGVAYDCREHWFLARVAAFQLDTDGFTELERHLIVGHRWWTVDDLAAATDRLVLISRPDPAGGVHSPPRGAKPLPHLSRRSTSDVGRASGVTNPTCCYVGTQWSVAFDTLHPVPWSVRRVPRPVAGRVGVACRAPTGQTRRTDQESLDRDLLGR